MLNAGRRKLVSDTQRYVLSMGQGMSSCRGLKVCKGDFFADVMVKSWLKHESSEAGSRPKGANGQHAMQQYNSTQRSL